VPPAWTVSATASSSSSSSSSADDAAVLRMRDGTWRWGGLDAADKDGDERNKEWCERRGYAWAWCGDDALLSWRRWGGAGGALVLLLSLDLVVAADLTDPCPWCEDAGRMTAAEVQDAAAAARIKAVGLMAVVVGMDEWMDGW